MGGITAICIPGDGSSTPKQNPKSEKLRTVSASYSEYDKKEDDGKTKEVIYNEKARIPCRTSKPPFISKPNTISFLASDYRKPAYISKYFTKDLKTEEITVQEVKCDNDKNGIDLANCVYTFNPNDNKLYFISNNKSLMTLDLTTNSIESLNKEIKTTSKNTAQIAYSDGKIFIFFAEEISNNQGNKNIIIVPSSGETTNQSEKDKQIIQRFGKEARIIKVKMDKKSDDDYIVMIGGARPETIKDEQGKEYLMNLPHDDIFIAKCDQGTGNCRYVQFSPDDADKKGKKPTKYQLKKGAKKYYTPYPLNSCGVINYENKYLFVFGGVEFKNQNPKKGHGGKFIHHIRFLVLTDKCEHGLIRYEWYDTSIQLPEHEAGCKKKRNFQYYHAFCDDETKLIHLFDYFGKHWTMEIDQFFKYIDEHSKLHPWTEQGKTVLPTKSPSIKNMDPAPNTEVDDMLEGLAEEHANEAYENLINVIHFSNYAEIVDEKNKDILKKEVKDDKMLDIIIKKAEELAGKKKK